jgi:hypothetical protein
MATRQEVVAALRTVVDELVAENFGPDLDTRNPLNNACVPVCALVAKIDALDAAQ